MGQSPNGDAKSVLIDESVPVGDGDGSDRRPTGDFRVGAKDIQSELDKLTDAQAAAIAKTDDAVSFNLQGGDATYTGRPAPGQPDINGRK